jgi:hypothetical protein
MLDSHFKNLNVAWDLLLHKLVRAGFSPYIFVRFFHSISLLFWIFTLQTCKGFSLYKPEFIILCIYCSAISLHKLLYNFSV